MKTIEVRTPTGRRELLRNASTYFIDEDNTEWTAYGNHDYQVLQDVHAGYADHVIQIVYFIEVGF